jgi:hypothetical protein
MSAPVASFADLLQSAVTEPGIMSSAYRQFHSYSLGNQLLAWSQCLERGLQPGPLATYPRWKELGRYVRKGEKALTLCMPVTIKRKAEQTDGSEEADVFTRFVYRPNWFTLTQTEGQPLAEQSIPAWDRNEALAALSIEEIPFDGLDGNCLGYARDRSIAINPVNPLPLKTTFHELGHVLLGHTTEGNQTDSDRRPEICGNVKPKQWPCFVVWPSTCRGWSSRADTSRHGGVLAIPSPNARHSGSSK